MGKIKASPDKPALSFQRNGETINLWVYDANQFCTVGQHKSMHFGGDKRAGLVYETKQYGHNATEYNIDRPGIWLWIQKHMEMGMRADELCKAIIAQKDLPLARANYEHWLAMAEEMIAQRDKRDAEEIAAK